MKKIMTIVIAAVIMAAAVAHASEECTSIREAKKLMELNRQADAVACLDKMKADVEANYLLGVISFKSGNYVRARDRFIAGPVRAKYAGEIVGLYKSAGDARLKAGDWKGAGDFYIEMKVYDPALAKETANNLFAQGKTPSGKDEYLFLASLLNPELKQAVSDYYYGLSKSAPNAEGKVKYLAKAAEFDNTRTAEYHESRDNLGRFHLDEAIKWAKKPGQEKAANENKALAKQYLGAAIVDQELPEKQVCSAGKYTFSLKAGEQTPFWIVFSVHNHDFNISSPEYDYEVVFDDGQRIKDGPNVNLPRKEHMKFRLYAHSNQEITMVVK